MINSENILKAITKKLSDNFDCDIFVNDSEGSFDKECFYVTLRPLPVQAISSNTNEKQLMISVAYFNNNKMQICNVADKLSKIFTRTIKVNEEFVNITNVEPNLLKDEIGDMLDFLITVYYFECIVEKDNSLSNVENIEIKFEK